MTDQQIRDAVATLLAHRDPPATICPSEAARALAPDTWRPLMPHVREGLVEIRQAGRVVAPDAPLHGPIRLARVDPP